MGNLKKLLKIIGRVIRRFVQVTLTMVLIGVCLYIYARHVEPGLLQVKEKHLSSSCFTTDMQPLVIVQFSDVHLGQYYSLEKFRKLVSKINSYDPDIVVFTGDLFDEGGKYKQAEEAALMLKELKAKKGKFAVYGNHDHGSNGSRLYKKVMQQGDFHLLYNSDVVINLEKEKMIRVIGIDDLVLGAPDLKKAFKNIKTNQYNLFVSHAPDVADKVKNYPIDLQLSGHSHGGQVCLPFLGAPFTPLYAREYIKGMYTFKDNKRMHLYVNTGIGTSQLPYRFFSMPELTVFSIKGE